MIAARQIFLGRGGDAQLPYDAEVEYLESTGTQWILAWSGVVDSTFGFKATFSIKAYEDNYAAGFSTTNNRRFLFWGAYAGNWRYGWGEISTTMTSPSFPYSQYPYGLDNYYMASINFMNNGKVSFGDDTLYDLRQVQYFQNTDFRIFRSFSVAVLSRFKNALLTYGTKVVRDMISVRFTNEFGQREGAMYDRVSGQLFRNSGTGAFLYGPDK